MNGSSEQQLGGSSLGRSARPLGKECLFLGNLAPGTGVGESVGFRLFFDPQPAFCRRLEVGKRAPSQGCPEIPRIAIWLLKSNRKEATSESFATRQ